MTEYIYNQLKGFAQAGKTPKLAEGKIDMFFSRFFALLLLAIGGTLSWYIFTYDPKPHLILKLALTYLPMLFLMLQFWRGISMRWMFHGLLKYWLPVLLLIYMYASLVFIGIEILMGNPSDELIIALAGSMLIVFSFFMFIVYFRNARAHSTGKSRTVSYVVAFMWLAFMAGGFIAIAVALGY